MEKAVHLSESLPEEDSVGDRQESYCVLSHVHLGDSLQTHMKGLYLNASMEHRDLENVNLKKRNTFIKIVRL